jgi:hypothetical protein
MLATDVFNGGGEDAKMLETNDLTSCDVSVESKCPIFTNSLGIALASRRHLSVN